MHRLTGFQSPSRFLNEMTLARQTGRSYDDPHGYYYTLKKEYLSGIKRFGKWPYLYFHSDSIRDNEFKLTITRDYRNYLLTLPEKKWYTKEVIDFLTWKKAIGSKSPFFKMFYQKGRRVDRIMKREGFSQSIVDQTIQFEVVDSVLGTKGEGLTGGAPDFSEADWVNLFKVLEKRFKSNAERALLDAQVAWYRRHNNTSKYRTYLFKSLNKYGIDPLKNRGERSINKVNTVMWGIFLSELDSNVLTEASNLMSSILTVSANDPFYQMYLDTYANLLYKLSRVTEAIRIEQMAADRLDKIAVSKGVKLSVNRYAEVVEKMKAGIPTWPVKKELKQ